MFLTWHRNSIDKWLKTAGYTYLALPNIIFLFGWLRQELAIPAVCVVTYGLYCAMRNENENWDFELNKSNLRIIILSILALTIWVFLSGIGAFSFQNGDHLYRNAVLKDMVDCYWPVLYNVQRPVVENSGTSQVFLMNYYFGFWLPAALLGKIFGVTFAFKLLFFWSLGGVLLSAYFIARYLRKFTILIVLALILFGGLSRIAGTPLLFWRFPELTNPTLFWWPYGEYSCITGQLFWVFNQSIPAWLATALMLNQKDGRNVVFLVVLCLIQAPLPAIGLIPIGAYYAFKVNPQVPGGVSICNYLKHKLLEWCSFQNTAASIAVLIFVGLFFKTNTAGSNIGLTEIISVPNLIVTMLFEFAVFWALIWNKGNCRRPLYYIILVALLVIPFIRVGLGIDFMWKASIPPLFVLTVYVVEFLMNFRRQGTSKLQQARYLLLCACLVIGAIVPLFTVIGRSVYMTAPQYISRHSPYINLRPLVSSPYSPEHMPFLTHASIYAMTEADRYNWRNFTAPLNKESFWFKYIMKRNTITGLRNNSPDATRNVSLETDIKFK